MERVGRDLPPVDQVLKDLADVQLAQQRAVDRVVQVRHDLGDPWGGYRRDRVTLGLQCADLSDVVERQQAYGQAGSRAQRVHLGFVGGKGSKDGLGKDRLVGAGVVLVRHPDVIAAALELRELPRPVHHRPHRIGGEGADVRALLLQEVPHRVSALGALVVVADRAGQRGLVPGVLRQQRHLGQHVVGVEGGIVGPLQVDDDGVHVRRRHLGHVGREQSGIVVVPVVVVGLQQVVDEREVTGGDRRPVGPLPRLQHDRDHGVVV